MMYLQLGEERFDPERPKLVPLGPDCDPKRIASLTAKKPNSRTNQANWVVWNGVSYSSGKVQPGWEDNERFFKYVKGARNRTWNGDAVAREFTIEKEEGRSGLWKQHIRNSQVQTIIPTRLRFRLPDADQGA